jgi:hypothetical protein
LSAQDEENDLVLAEGVCFGWFSSVNSKCQPSSCLQSARCQQYSVTLQQTSGLLDLKGTIPVSVKNEVHVENESCPSSSDDIVQRAFFDHVINIIIQNVAHDDVHYDPTHTWATLKNSRLVVCFVIRNKKNIKVKMGGSKDTDRPELEIAMGTNIDDIKHELVAFLKKNV